MDMEMVSELKMDGADCGYIARLSEKSKNGDFSNVACNKIDNLQTSKWQI